jgi:hypothetical protein
MNGPEKSDLPIVAGKLANGAAQAAEEPVERRGGTKENADPQTTDAEPGSRVTCAGPHTRSRSQLLHHISLDSHVDILYAIRGADFGRSHNPLILSKSC